MRQGFTQFSPGLLKLMAKDQQAASELSKQKEEPK
jgi:hypothetical protein